MRAARSEKRFSTSSGLAFVGKTASALLIAGGLATLGIPALAGVGLGVTPVFPQSVKVGQTGLPADVVITYRNTAPNNTNGDRVNSIAITPACGTSSPGSVTCPAGSLEAGVPTPISLSANAVGSADCRDPAAPAVIPNPPRAFVISPPGTPGGPWNITPDFYLPPGGTCIISFMININALPSKDSSSLSGVQTAAIASAAAVDAVDLVSTGGGLGAAVISFPILTTTPSPGGNLGGGPLTLSDSATITGLVPTAANNPPTGTVTFRLFAPTDPTCAGAPSQSQVVNLTDPARCTITPATFQTNCTTGPPPFTVNAAGIWRWTASYSGDPNNVSVASGCPAEPVTIGPAQPVLTTVPTPSPGKVGGILNDTAQLTSGVSPFAGSITFNLFDPTQTNCSGVPRYTQTVPVSASGAAATTSNFAADSSGTWQWTANYNGDANNLPAASACGAEPVVVPRPVLTIAKTPKGTSYAAGQTISFSILVTNTGPGTALNVRFAPADALPDPNKSLNWGVSTQPAGNPCAISGAVGSQVLDCNFGNLAEGATASVSVQTATQAADPGDCGNPLVLNNSATVVGDNADAKTDTGSLNCTPGATTLVTTPVPANGKVGGPALNDSAQLSGTAPFVGSITFNLFDPTQTNCTGAPRFTQIVAVTGAGAAATTGGFVPDKSGTWQWTASYPGDANHTAAVSGCGSEPVSIARPVLTIAKTPDNGTYSPGQTINFTIVVTNSGPGTAQAVTFAPADLLPDPNKSLNWTVTTQPVGGNCTVTGAAGTQALNCAFGDLLEGVSSTVVVSTPTEVADLGDCPVGVALTNTATVTAANADPKTDGGSQSCLGRPVLTIQKTPDGGIYAAGDTISFSIAVTNSGPGVAQNVRFEPADIMPDPNGSLNWSISQQPAQGTCAISGAIGAQILNCNFGNIPQGTTLTVSVKTDTQVGDPGDCSPNGTILSNSATVVGDNTNTATDTGSLSCKVSRPIPTISNLGLILLMLIFAGTGCAILRRRYH